MKSYDLPLYSLAITCRELSRMKESTRLDRWNAMFNEGSQKTFESWNKVCMFDSSI